MGLPALKRGIYYATSFGKIGGDVLNMWLGPRIGRLRCLQIGFVGLSACTLALALPMMGRHASLLFFAAF